MTKYKCITPCVWQKRYWRYGDIYEGDLTPPKHFEVYVEQGNSGSSGGQDGTNPTTCACDCETKDWYFDVLQAPKITASGFNNEKENNNSDNSDSVDNNSDKHDTDGSETQQTADLAKQSTSSLKASSSKSARTQKTVKVSEA